MKFKLCDWEDNGYHDSYFYGVYFDTDDGKLHHASLGATAYAGGIGFDSDTKAATPEIAELARLELVKLIHASLKAIDLRQVMEPDDAKQGDILQVSMQHNSRKTSLPLVVGLKIRVNTCNAFGTFYKNGYNKPNRLNRSVVGTVLGNPAVLIRIPLAKCRLDREPMTDDQLNEAAERLSHEHNYGRHFGCKAWLSNNWALTASKQLQAA